MSDRRFQDGERVVGIDRFDRGEPCILHDIDRAHPQHHLVFDNQNGREEAAVTPGAMVAGHFHLEPMGLARASCSLVASNV